MKRSFLHTIVIFFSFFFLVPHSEEVMNAIARVIFSVSYDVRLVRLDTVTGACRPVGLD